MIYLPKGHDDLESFLSSLEQGEDCLAVHSSVGKQSGMSNSTNTANKSCKQELKTDTSTMPQSSETSESLTKEDMRKPMLDTSILSVQASLSHANHLVSQESNAAQTIPETSGQIPYEPFAWYDRDTSSWRTCQACFREIIITSEQYLETWPQAVTVLDMVAYRLPKLEHHTGATDSGLWQTPTTMEHLGLRPQTTVARQFEKARKGRSYASINLREQVIWGKRPSYEDVTTGKLWRTPASSDGEGGIMEMREGKSGHYKLRDHVQEINKDQWPTPAANPPGWKDIEVVDKDGNVPEHANQRFYDKNTGRLVQKGLQQVVYPTPATVDGGSYFNKSKSAGAANRPTLGAMAKYNLWPTPSANKTTPSSKDPTKILNSQGMPIERGEKPYLNGKPVQTALSDAVSWPTPTSRDHKDTGQAVAEGRVPVNCLLGRAVWPTPHAGGRDGVTGGGHAGLASSEAMREKLKEHGEEGKKMATQALNPDWVAWLMGWPIRWECLEPLESFEFWLENQDRWWEVDPANVDFIPRVTPQKTNRVNRLKALGNGQVPQCMAIAWLSLQIINWTENRVIRHVEVESVTASEPEDTQQKLFNF